MSTAAIPTELTAPGSSSILNKKIRPSDLILTVLIDLAAIFSILLLIAIMGYVFFRGLPQISLSFLTSVPSVHDPHDPAPLRNARHYHRYHSCDRTYRWRIRRPFIHRRKRLSSAQDLCRIFQKNLRIRRNPYDPAVLEHVQGTI